MTLSKAYEENKRDEYLRHFKEVFGSPDTFARISSFLTFFELQSVFASRIFRQVVSDEMRYQQGIISQWRELAENGDSFYQHEYRQSYTYSKHIPSDDDDFCESLVSTRVKADDLNKVRGIRHFPRLLSFHVTRSMDSEIDFNGNGLNTDFASTIVFRECPIPADVLRHATLLHLELKGLNFTFGDCRVDFPNLVAISIMDNEVLQTLPDSFSACSKLQKVRLKNCPRFHRLPVSVLKCLNSGRMVKARQDLFDKKIEEFEFDLVYTDTYEIPDNPGIDIYDYVEYFGMEDVDEPVLDSFNSISLSGCILTMQNVRKICFQSGFRNLQHLFLLRRFHIVDE